MTTVTKPEVVVADDVTIQRYREAGHWRAILAGCDAIAGGEHRGKVTHVLSGLSSGLEDKLHIYAMSRTQGGKSWLQKRLGIGLFPDFECANTSSPKAPYYEAKDNPKCFENSVRMYDEFRDQSAEFQSQIKTLTSHGVRNVILKTVDTDRKFLKASIDGLPVVWINSEAPVQDEQVLNRFFKMNLDESTAQDGLVEKFQKEEEKLGDKRKRSEGVIGQARSEISFILGDKNICVLNPFAEFLKVVVPGNRNMRPMISTIVKTLAYSNRIIRPCVDDRTILASLSDNIIGFYVWNWYERFQICKVPERHLRFLGALEPNRRYTNEELADAYARKYPNERKLSPDSCYQYAHHLETLNLMGSDGGWKGKVWYSISVPGKATAVSYSPAGALSSLTFGSLEFRFPTSDELAEELSSIKTEYLTGSSTTKTLADVDAVSIELLDWDFLLRIADVLEVDLPNLTGSHHKASNTVTLNLVRTSSQLAEQEVVH